MLTEKEKLDTLTRLGIELNQVQDMDILMERILTEARRFVNADAGSIYIKDNDSLLFSYTQNDTLQKRLAEGEKLIYNTFTMPIDQTSIAGCVASEGECLNLPDVYEIDANAPYTHNKSFDREAGYRTRSNLTVPLKTMRGDILGILQVLNAQDEDDQIIPFPQEDERMMLHFASTATVALERARMTRAIILRMIRMAEMRDPKETGAHVNRVGSYSVEIYEKWAKNHGLPQREIDTNRDILRTSAMLHDVGKVAISDLILKKPGGFDVDEFEIMKQHTILGARLFGDIQSDFDEAACQVALNHHERWNGEKGYPGHVDILTGAPLEGHALPDGSPKPKKGEEIPLFGRIVALADVFDALSSKRVYKEAMEEDKTLSIIEEEAGAHFEPELVEIFFSIIEIIRSIQKRYVDEPDE
ncbi:MAG: HD domain-containing protein [Deltaproteobacteria bacterium]|nr:HD domain-containing protein [Deltaproteobacteria bacterium]